MLATLLLFLSALPARAQGGGVAGTVLDADGSALQGVLVSLRNADGGDARKSAVSDEQGGFSIADVPAGTYTATASMTGVQSVSAPANVTAGAVATLDFQLAPSFHDAIVVTAQKVEENILDVPMTITAFDSSALEELVLQDKTDLQNLVPGLQFGDEMDQEGQGTVIRGIGTRLAGRPIRT